MSAENASAWAAGVLIKNDTAKNNMVKDKTTAIFPIIAFSFFRYDSNLVNYTFFFFCQ
jgi:hypothetical protein